MRSKRQKKRASLLDRICQQKSSVSKTFVAKKKCHSKASKASGSKPPRFCNKASRSKNSAVIRDVKEVKNTKSPKQIKSVESSATCKASRITHITCLSPSLRKPADNSSAPAEPSQSVSFTGQHRSPKNIKGAHPDASVITPRGQNHTLMNGIKKDVKPVSCDDDDDDDDVISDAVTIPDDEVLCVDDDDDDDDGNDGSIMKNVHSENGRSLRDMELHVFGLRMELKRMRQDYELKLKMKDDQIEYLKNELRWKDEQLQTMNELADLNVKLQSQITSMLSDQKEYEKEVEKKKEIDKKREQMEKEKKEKKDQEDKEEKLNKQVEKENKRKRKDDDKTAQEKKIDKKRSADNEKDEIDAYFVEDDSDVEFVKEEKIQKKSIDKKCEAKSEEKQENIVSNESESPAAKSRHSIRKLMTSTKLMGETKQAAKEEKERIERAKKEHDKHLRVMESNKNKKEPITKQLVLAFKEGTQAPLVEVNPKLIRKLKPHQVDAVEFIWDNIIESVDRLKENAEGSGCILAHCMGLGKTLSVITVIHTLLTVKSIGFRYCLIVCPLNTVLNWQFELEKWLDKKDRLKVFELASCRNNHQRVECLSEWRKTGGVMITGYQLFRILVSYSGRSKKVKETIDKALLDPGPDVVVCDEGHILKNDASAISKCMNKIRTKRRVVLTGTPLQNNLVEYHCMVNFVKPNLLGSRREFNNRFVNPITNGQHSDSTPFDVKLMKRRAHILHSMLDGCVQRRDYSALTAFLPPKYEYVLSVRLSPLQIELYQKYLELFRPEASRVNFGDGTGTGERFKVKGSGLFTDYQNLMRIWTHPWLLKLEEARQEKKPFTEYDDELESVLFTSSSEDEDEIELSDSLSVTSSATGSPSDNELTPDVKEHNTEEGCRNTRSKKLNQETVAPGAEKEDIVQQKRKKKRIKCSGKRKQSETDLDSDKHSNNRKCQEVGVKKCKQTRQDDDCVKVHLSTDVERTSTAKLYAGEVVKQWQTQSRRTEPAGNEKELNRKKEAAWWSKYVTDDMKNKLELSGKFVLMFEIIRMAEAVGDKVLLFSQSILTLDMIEEFLAMKDGEAKTSKGKKKQSRWQRDEDYCRMDGTTGVHNRKKLTCNFNSIKNKRMRLFLISTKAGGLGINLDSANRVIIFNASWNPSHDIQSIFRVYRFGQDKPVFVYRLLAQGTMEEKIYERQVTKETLAQRVVDERQIDRHFTSDDLQELYQFKPDRLDDPNREKRPTPAVPKDLILAELLSSQKEWIVQYHEHDSLLENRPDEGLSEEERKNAWEEYEREKRGLGTLYRTIPPNYSLNTMAAYNYNRAGTLPLSPPAGGTSSATGVNNVPFIKSLSETNSDINAQIAQLPRVVQEIIKFNPSVTSDELSRRLRTFLGMHKYYGEIPGFAAEHQVTGKGSTSQNAPSTSGVINPSQGNHVAEPGRVLRVDLSRVQANLGPHVNLPSRLPLPGPLPASRN